MLILSPCEVEIAVMPYFTDDSTHPYKGIKKLIETVGPNRSLTVTIHLDFHNKLDSTKLQSIGQRAAEFDTFARQINGKRWANNITFKVSPSLEDECKHYSVAEEALKNVAAKLHTNKNINLRRSATVFGRDGSAPSTISVNGRTFVVQTELHGFIDTSKLSTYQAVKPSFSAYSNDGNFVWMTDYSFLVNNPATGLPVEVQEFAGSFHNATSQPDDAAHKYDSDSFDILANDPPLKSLTTILLWRPSYNGLISANPTQEIVDLGGGNEGIVYNEVSATMPHRHNITALDDMEIELLRRFLCIPK